MKLHTEAFHLKKWSSVLLKVFTALGPSLCIKETTQKELEHSHWEQIYLKTLHCQHHTWHLLLMWQWKPLCSGPWCFHSNSLLTFHLASHVWLCRHPHGAKPSCHPTGTIPSLSCVCPHEQPVHNSPSLLARLLPRTGHVRCSGSSKDSVCGHHTWYHSAAVQQQLTLSVSNPAGLGHIMEWVAADSCTWQRVPANRPCTIHTPVT